MTVMAYLVLAVHYAAIVFLSLFHRGRAHKYAVSHRRIVYCSHDHVALQAQSVPLSLKKTLMTSYLKPTCLPMGFCLQGVFYWLPFSASILIG